MGRVNVNVEDWNLRQSRRNVTDLTESCAFFQPGNNSPPLLSKSKLGEENVVVNMKPDAVTNSEAASEHQPETG